MESRGGRHRSRARDLAVVVSRLRSLWRNLRYRDRVERDLDDEMNSTLDLLIERFGEPAFVKIDVEGAEPSVLAGLSRPVRALSFEYLPRALDHVQLCLTRLAGLGRYRFNWSVGESSRLAESSWLEPQDLLARLRTPQAQRRPGDVYVRLVRSSWSRPRGGDSSAPERNPGRAPAHRARRGRAS